MFVPLQLNLAKNSPIYKKLLGEIYSWGFLLQIHDLVYKYKRFTLGNSIIEKNYSELL